MSPGRQLGPYRLLKRLGTGGMAEVFLALAFGASGFEKRVVIKTLRAELQGDFELEKMFIEEARLGARLAHRNLLGVHDLGTADGVYYVRMDWVDGGDLGTLLAHARPPVSLALFVAEELALGLDYVHRLTDDEGRPLGLVHRDVSPSNVLLSREGEVKLADFGVAKATLLADVTQGGVRKGKYPYMSPEQVTGAQVTARSDQFSLGVTLMEMLVGRRPFDADSPLETMERVREARPPELPELTPELRAVIHRCLARAPGDRYPSAEALRRDLALTRKAFEPCAPPDLARWVRERAG